MTRRSASGSRRSPSAVEPVTSEKTIVTILRVSPMRRVYDSANQGSNESRRGPSTDELGQRNAAAFAAPPERTRVDPSQTAILSPEPPRPRLESGRAGVQPIGFS